MEWNEAVRKTDEGWSVKETTKNWDKTHYKTHYKKEEAVKIGIKGDQWIKRKHGQVKIASTKRRELKKTSPLKPHYSNDSNIHIDSIVVINPCF